MENSVICRLTVRLPDGQVLTKSDAGGYAGMADQGDDDKSGFSDSFKRACAKLGVAPLPLPRRRPPHLSASASRLSSRFRPPSLPWPKTAVTERAGTYRGGRDNGPPRTGKAPLRVDEGPGAAARGRPAEIPQRLGRSCKISPAAWSTGTPTRWPWPTARPAANYKRFSPTRNEAFEEALAN